VAALDDQVGRRTGRLRSCYLRPLRGINGGALEDGIFGWPAAMGNPLRGSRESRSAITQDPSEARDDIIEGAG